MQERVSPLGWLHLIYCLDLMPDGSYVALNYRYKPIGFSSTEHVEYEKFPVRFKFQRALSARQIASLSANGDASPDRIYLYRKGANPIRTPANWAEYTDRIRRLMKHTVEH